MKLFIRMMFLMGIYVLSQVSLNAQITLVDDYADVDNRNYFDGALRVYSDVSEGGETNSYPDAGSDFEMPYDHFNYTAHLSFFLNSGIIYNSQPYVGFETFFTESEIPVDFTGADGFSFYYKGESCRFYVVTASTAGAGLFGVDIPMQSDWSTITINWADLYQEGINNSEIDITEVISIRWEVTGQDGDIGQIWIDNVNILAENFIVVEELEQKIDSAQAILGNAVVGEEPGEYTDSVIAEFESSILDAQNIINSVNTTQEDIHNANNNLDISISTFLYNVNYNQEYFDDFEDYDGVNNYGGRWFIYSDIGNGGASSVIPDPMQEFFPTENGVNGSNYACHISFFLDQGELSFNPFVGLYTSLTENEVALDLRSTTGISFWYKGYSFRVYAEMDILYHSDFHGVHIEGSDEWQFISLQWSDFEQAGWGEIHDLDLSIIDGFGFMVQDNDGTVGELWLDDISILGAHFANTSSLNALITTSQERYDTTQEGDDVGQFSSAVRADFYNAIMSALLLRDNVTAHQVEVNDEITALQLAIETYNASVNTGNFEELESTISSVQNILDTVSVGYAEGQYTPEAVEEMERAVISAQLLLGNEHITQNTIDNAVITLENAEITFLQSQIVINTENLENLINSAQYVHDQAIEGDGNGLYPYGSRNRLQGAIDSAILVLNYNEIGYNNIIDIETYLNSELVYFQSLVQRANYYELEYTIELAEIIYSSTEEGVGNEQYHAEDREIFRNAIDSAIAVLSNNSASQTEIDNAEDFLNESITIYSESEINIDDSNFTEIYEESLTVFSTIDPREDIGMQVGQYPQYSYFNLREAILSGSSYINSHPNYTQVEVDSVAESLTNALNAFYDSQIREEIDIEEIFLPVSLGMVVGDSEIIYPFISPENATEDSIIWNSSDRGIVTVNNGVIEAQAQGMAYVSATSLSGDVISYIRVYVSQNEIPLERISLGEENIILQIEESVQITPSFEPLNSTDQSVMWFSSDPDIASVNNNGIVTGISSGNVAVTVVSYSNQEIIASCNIRVVRSAPPIVLSNAVVEIDTSGTAFIDLSNFIEDDSTLFRNLVISDIFLTNNNVDYSALIIENRLLSVEFYGNPVAPRDTIFITFQDEDSLETELIVEIQFLAYQNLPPVFNFFAAEISNGEEFAINIADFVSDDTDMAIDIQFNFSESEFISINTTEDSIFIIPVEVNWYGVDTIRIVATDSYGGTDSIDFVVRVRRNQSTGILANHNVMRVYPNPASDVISVSTGDVFAGTVVVDLVAPAGEIIDSKTIENGVIDCQFDVSDLAKGVYQIRINSNTEIVTQSVIVE